MLDEELIKRVLREDYRLVRYETDIKFEKEELVALKDILNSEYKVLKGSIKYEDNKYKGFVVAPIDELLDLIDFLKENKFSVSVEKVTDL